jgi:hypothetical protein
LTLDVINISITALCIVTLCVSFRYNNPYLEGENSEFPFTVVRFADLDPVPLQRRVGVYSAASSENRLSFICLALLTWTNILRRGTCLHICRICFLFSLQPLQKNVEIVGNMCSICSNSSLPLHTL